MMKKYLYLIMFCFLPILAHGVDHVAVFGACRQLNSSHNACPDEQGGRCAVDFVENGRAYAIVCTSADACVKIDSSSIRQNFCERANEPRNTVVRFFVPGTWKNNDCHCNAGHTAIRAVEPGTFSVPGAQVRGCIRDLRRCVDCDARGPMNMQHLMHSLYCPN